MLFEMKSSSGQLTVTYGGARTATPTGHPAPTMRAERRGVLSSTWDIACPSGRYELKQSFFGREYRLSRDGVQVGTSGHDMWTWGIRPKLTVQAIPPEDGVFLLWIAFIMRRRQQSAAASSSS